MALLDSSRTGEAAPEGSEYPERRWILVPESRPDGVLSVLRESSRTTTASPAVSAVDEWMHANDPDTSLVQPATVAHDAPPQARFRSLQSWEGRVVEVLKDSFVGVLADMTMPGVEEQVELDLEEVTPDDLPLVQPGAVFYWSIGYRAEPSGTRSRASEIRFRRLPRWSEAEIRDVAHRVKALKARLGRAT
jgi:hypothetical protein